MYVMGFRRINFLLQRWKPHIEFHTIIGLKSEQRTVHVRGMFPLQEVTDVRDHQYITLEKVLFSTQHIDLKSICSFMSEKRN